jgi:hypothetical protein
MIIGMVLVVKIKQPPYEYSAGGENKTAPL